MADTNAQTTYLPGWKPSQVKHHAWRNAENSAGYLLTSLEAMRQKNPKLQMLDVGAGPGTISASLAERIPEGHVTATDLAEEVLSQARDHAKTVGVDNITFQEANVYSLPFSDDSFDVTHAHQVLCHLERPVDAVREMLRVTKPGGLVALRESDLEMWCVWPELPALTRFHEVLLKTHASYGGSTKGGRQLLSWVLSAGAKRDDVTMSFGTWCYSAPGDRETWGDAMAQRTAEGGMRKKGVEMQVATENEFDEMTEAWREWAKAPDAVQGIMNGEALVRV